MKRSSAVIMTANRWSTFRQMISTELATPANSNLAGRQMETVLCPSMPGTHL